jgi:type I restriction enzyme, S subunit
MSKWKEYYLNDVYTISSGLSKPAESFGFGFPFLSFKEVFNNFFLPDRLSELVDSSEKERLQCSIKKGDVFLTRTSETVKDLGMSCVAIKDYDNATFNGFTKRLRLNGTIEVIPEYAGYYFRNSQFRKEITTMSSASTRASLNNEMIGRLKIILPSKAEQLSIGFALKILDDSIDNLRRQNETLEEIARSIFKHWFIDFEFPNADGKPYRSTGGAMVASELGDIPEGWRVGKLGDIGKIITGKTPSTQSSELWGDDLPFITPTDFKNYGKYILGAERKISRLASAKFKNYIIPEKSIIVTCIGSDMGKVVKTAISCITNQQINSIILFDKTNFHEYIFNHLRNQYKLLRNIALGGSTMPIINKTAFSNIEIIIPSIKSLSIFENIVSPLNDKIINNDSSIQTLTKTRDTLLPKLMSGQLRVRE